MQRIISNHYVQLYTKKLDTLEEMDKFRETHNIIRLNHKETENLNGQITSKEIEWVIKHILTNKSAWSDGFTGEVCQTLKELIPMFLKLFEKTRGSHTSKLILQGQHYPD